MKLGIIIEREDYCKTSLWFLSGYRVKQGVWAAKMRLLSLSILIQYYLLLLLLSLPNECLETYCFTFLIIIIIIIIILLLLEILSDHFL